MAFKQIDAEDFLVNSITLFRDTWGLLTAGGREHFNTMTVSWGMLGELWGVDAAMVFVRPQRYTKEFMDAYDSFTLSFLPKGKDSKKIHGVCGTKSGKELDKIAKTGLIPVDLDGCVCFEQAQTVLLCRKLAAQSFSPDCFLTDIPKEIYPDKDYHSFYVGKIEKILVSG